MTVRTD
jgi:hypothetical protein